MYIDKKGQAWYKVGLHVHTTLSDGIKTPEEAAMIYKNAGFDAIAITDHWVYGEEAEISGLKIISGCEYNLGASDTSVDVMHIVGVGLKKSPDYITKESTRQEIIDAIKQNGGFVILAHPAWSLNSPDDAVSLLGIDAVEIYNTVSDVNQSSRPYSGYFVDLLANKGVIYPLIATDDTHYYDGNDETKSYIMVNSESDSAEDILEAVRQCRFYATQGPELYVKRESNKIIADCSECVHIDFLSNSAWARDKMVRSEGVTHAEYTIKQWEKWIRVEVKDKYGNCAWSNIINL